VLWYLTRVTTPGVSGQNFKDTKRERKTKRNLFRNVRPSARRKKTLSACGRGGEGWEKIKPESKLEPSRCLQIWSGEGKANEIVPNER